ncbi:hypothetical protein Tco_1428512 [Tanacetum coccineum]
MRQETIGDIIAQTRFENVSKHSNDPLIAKDVIEMIVESKMFVKTAEETRSVVEEVTDVTIPVKLKSAKPKADKVVIQEPEQEEEEEEEEEERLVREKAQQVEEANIAWDDVQAKINADYHLAQRLPAQEQEELTDEEKARILYILRAKKIHFTQLREQKKIWNIPPTKSSNKGVSWQKLEEDKESEEHKQCLDIITDDGDDVTFDATPLSTKSPTIMLKNFDREDLEVLWSIVKARFKKTEPVNYMDDFLLLILKTMFEHHVEDNGRIVGIKRLHDDLEVTATKITTAGVKKLNLPKNKSYNYSEDEDDKEFLLSEKG